MNNQYHVGHCDCILRENGHPATAWISIYGWPEKKSSDTKFVSDEK